MKQIIILLIITVISGLPVCSQAQPERQPFSQPPVWRPSLRSSPGDGLPNDNSGGGSFNGGAITVFGGPGEGLPNGDEGGGGFVGMPVSDALWFILLLAVGYGLMRRRFYKKLERRVSPLEGRE